jgi:serine/threonine-protein kinase
MSCELPDIGIFPEHYEIREVLRESMVSTVLLAHDFDVQTDVVIKCFKPSAKGAYLREIAAAFDLNHPNLVLCLNTFYRQDGVPCIVYEYLSGGSLMDLLANQQRIGLASSIACLKDMLGVLAYLHSGNRIHCDLKPENILLRPKPNGDYDFVLIDLGAACFLRDIGRNGRTARHPFLPYRQLSCSGFGLCPLCRYLRPASARTTVQNLVDQFPATNCRL